ncbi:non-specific lipid-transfer protein 2-like [Dioscorea cayenensis subsp. rotundata]|uniref:Non-specific lipid-transfer protein 2-like n=1 Tax=Dioscorea cayennensis subsp. rotundata TaxID=55577 RepID=A0AB40B442_DIOCR|nr:non-specific lipid-transfer protein 2-like [Dioscorea cayenensis subsp. rotundata]
MMKMKVLLLCFISTTLMMLLLSVSNAKAAGKPVMTCNPLELSSCADAILSGANPSATCCAKLKQQQPCFCEYVKKPNLKGYINSKNGRKVADTCKVPIPRCP